MTSFNALYKVITPAVSEEAKVEIHRRVIAKMGEQNRARFESMFPKLLIAPGIDVSAETRLRNYMLKLVAAYPEDEAGRIAELEMLLDPDYIKAFKLGLVPPPLSHPWAVFIKVPWLFSKMQADMRRLYLRFVRGVE